MIRATIIFACLWSIVCVTTKVEHEPAPIVEWRVKTTDSLPLAQAKNLGKFKITYYWIVDETKYKGQRTIPLYLENGKVLDRFPKQFIKDFKKESVARLKDGRLISYLKRKNAVRVVNEPLGSKNYTLSTFKSVAVDTQLIPLGSTLFIPNFERLYLGNSGVHNGVFYANDVGSQVKGNHIDIYIGELDNLSYVRSKTGIGSGLVDVYLLE